jgi:Zn-finger nucleic acid-binding protein
MRLEADRNFLSCDCCGSEYFPEPNSDGVRLLGESRSLACPICAIALVHASVGDRRILYCTRCRAMLIRMEIFMAIVQDLRSHRQASLDSARQPDRRKMNRRLSCPQCHRTMDTHPYGGGGNVLIDDCENCSLNWLDCGDLDTIVRAPDHDYLGQAWDLSGLAQER